MNELIYTFRESNVRVIEKDGQPWFVAKDVCDVLNHTNSRMAISRLDEDEKGVSKVYTPGGYQDMSIINEFGLYTLILNSNLKEAKEFKRWITHEVIPSIRKNGTYTKQPMSTLEMMNLQIQQMIKHEKELEELKIKAQSIETKVNEFKDVIGTNSDNWRTETAVLIKRIANNMGGSHMIRNVHNAIYGDLESRGKCNLDIRLSNFKKRCERLGVPSSKVAAKNKLDVIAEDSKLIEIYVSIVKEYSIKGRI